MHDTTPPLREAPAHTYPKLSIAQCLGLGVGGIPDIGMQYAMKGMANPIFNLIYGVDPILIGIAFALPRFWEIFIDPWIGITSDRTSGPLGRRHPYMIWGALFGCLTFMLVWFVPGSFSPAMKGGWLIALALAHFTAYSFFMVPYSARLGEVSAVPEQRMKVMAYRTAFVSLGSLLIGWLYWLCQRDWFSGPAEGMKVVGIGFGLILLAGALLPVFVCRKSRQYQAGDSGINQMKEMAVLRELWGVKSFRGILLAVFSLVAVSLLVSNLGFYISLCFVFHGDTKAVAVLGGIGGTVNSLASIAFCPVVNVCTQKWGERKTLFLFLAVAAGGNLLGYWAAQPAWPYAVVLTNVLGNFGLTAFWVIMPALTGEISRRHEMATGQSIYGAFYALYGMAIKIGASVGLLFAGVVLNLTHYRTLLGANQSEATILLMRLLNSIGPALGVAIAAYFIFKSLPRFGASTPSAG